MSYSSDSHGSADPRCVPRARHRRDTLSVSAWGGQVTVGLMGRRPR